MRIEFAAAGAGRSPRRPCGQSAHTAGRRVL